MSWSVTVNNVPQYEKLEVETEEFFASQHPSYPRDAGAALVLAKLAGLKSATLCGARTPNPYGGDEIVDISVRGTPVYQDFLSEMQEIIRQGPDAGSDIARHYAALAILRARPCAHIFESVDYNDHSGLQRCQGCGVYLNGTMLYFAEDDNGVHA